MCGYVCPCVSYFCEYDCSFRQQPSQAYPVHQKGSEKGVCEVCLIGNGGVCPADIARIPGHNRDVGICHEMEESSMIVGTNCDISYGFGDKVG